MNSITATITATHLIMLRSAINPTNRFNAIEFDVLKRLLNSICRVFSPKVVDRNTYAVEKRNQ